MSSAAKKAGTPYHVVHRLHDSFSKLHNFCNCPPLLVPHTPNLSKIILYTDRLNFFIFTFFAGASVSFLHFCILYKTSINTNLYLNCCKIWHTFRGEFMDCFNGHRVVDDNLHQKRQIFLSRLHGND